MAGKDRVRRGMGAKDRHGSWPLARSTSTGATSRAPRSSRWCSAAQWRMAMQPRAWPTRMGGANAPDDLRLGHLTQEWLATSDDPEALTSGGYWHHQLRAEPHPSVRDEHFQAELLDALAEFTGSRLA